jgi:hypothetical protein
VPLLARDSPILLCAVLSFAARHRGDAATAEQAYQQCLGLLIDRLNSSSVADDDAVLCAIVILRVVEQLSGTVTDPYMAPSYANAQSVTATGADFEQHLAGCAAILRASQGQTIDPAAPTLRDVSSHTSQPCRQRVFGQPIT